MCHQFLMSPCSLGPRPPGLPTGPHTAGGSMPKERVTVPGCREAPSSTACPGQLTWLLANSRAVVRGLVPTCCCWQLAHAVLGEVPGQHLFC